MPPSKKDRLQVARETLEASQRAAQRVTERVGLKDLRKLLEEAQTDLNRRIASLDARGLDDSFTAVQLRGCLRQVEYVLGPLTRGMKNTLINVGERNAQQAAEYAAEYLAASERAYVGIAQPLALDRALMINAATQGANSSLLSRIAHGHKHHRHARAQRGVLERYGLETIEHFEKKMRLGMIAKKSWREMRDDLVEESPFLQGAPKYWSERLLRTELMSAAGRGALEATKEANRQLGDVVKIISSIFDERTGSDSICIHGQIRRPDEDFESWYGPFEHPADRPNDRAVMTTHRIVWPIPEYLKPRSWEEVLARWKLEGRKGAPPDRPDPMTTVPLSSFGRG
jgi:hypothetical protein